MSDISQVIRHRRNEMGLTQAKLSAMAAVSLATVQNLEAGRANPSFDILERILTNLGLAISVQEQSADWDILSALGLPLTPEKPVSLLPDKFTLARHLHLAIREAGEPDCDGRKTEATAALLLALRDHYPDFFRKNFARSSGAKKLLSGDTAGPIIKLRRIALARISEYL